MKDALLVGYDSDNPTIQNKNNTTHDPNTVNTMQQPSEVATLSKNYPDFHIAELDNTVKSHWVPEAMWEQSFICPCATSQSGSLSPDPLCPICHGKGIGYLPGIPLGVSITHQSKNSVFNNYGMFEEAASKATIELGKEVSLRDRISISSLTTRQSYMFNVTEDRASNGIFIPYDVRNFIYIVSKKVNESMRNLVEQKDFVYDAETHKINIINTDLVGSNISFVADVVVRYIVTGLPHELRYQKGQKLWRQVSMQREDIFNVNVNIIDNNNVSLSRSSQDILSGISNNSALGLNA